MTHPPQQTTARRRKGPRPKHVPQRTCVACREKGDKRGLVRIVRTPERTVAIDPTGKRNGRGAYLCHDPRCWDRALAGGALARALDVEITAETRRELQTFADTLESEIPERPAVDSQGANE